MKFVYHTNRASRIFSTGLGPLGGRAWQAGDEQIDLSYYCEYESERPPELPQPVHGLIERRKTMALDHKLLLARRLIKHKLDNPRIYLDPKDVPADNEQLWFIKDPLGSGGKGIQVCHHAELEKHFRRGYIIQEAVADLALIEGRKFTLRSYVLAHDGHVYHYPDSVIVVHGQRYDRDSTSPQVQYSHENYMNPGAAVKMIPSYQYSRYAEIVPRISNTLTSVFSLFSAELGDPKDSRNYCLFGIDLVEDASGAVKLLEINDRPNLVHTKNINEHVNIKLLRAMTGIILPGLGYRPGQGESRFKLILDF